MLDIIKTWWYWIVLLLRWAGTLLNSTTQSQTLRWLFPPCMGPYCPTEGALSQGKNKLKNFHVNCPPLDSIFIYFPHNSSCVSPMIWSLSAPWAPRHRHAIRQETRKLKYFADKKISAEKFYRILWCTIIRHETPIQCSDSSLSYSSLIKILVKLLQICCPSSSFSHRGSRLHGFPHDSQVGSNNLKWKKSDQTICSRHSMQLLDEVPMIWGSCYMLYCMHMVSESLCQNIDTLLTEI